MAIWHLRSFQELNTTELYDILALREAVFTLEQKCFYQDIDYNDQKAIHLLGIENNQLAAYCRIFSPNHAYPDATSIGRVLTASFARGTGLGRTAIQQCLLYLKKQHPNDPIVISAQLYLQAFYESFGFHIIGEPYEDAGIPHIKMRKETP
jgi:ElaA protein